MHPLVVAHMRRHQRKLSEEKIRRIVEIGLREQLRLAGEIKHYPGDESANLLRGIKLANEHAMWATTLTVTSALFPSSEAQLIQRGPWDMAAEIIQLAETAAAEKKREIRRRTFVYRCSEVSSHTGWQTLMKRNPPTKMPFN